jgi:hypothetical protein
VDRQVLWLLTIEVGNVAIFESCHNFSISILIAKLGTFLWLGVRMGLSEDHSAAALKLTTWELDTASFLEGLEGYHDYHAWVWHYWEDQKDSKENG